MTERDPPLRVLVADEHATTRAGIRMSLDGHGFEVVAEAATGGEAIEAAAKARPDLCLLDADMPGDPVHAAGEIFAALPHTVIVMLAAEAEEEALFASLGAGAQGYLLKDMDATRLPYALQGVMAGEAALPRALVSAVLNEFRVRRRRRSSPALERLGVELTEREWEVLEMLRGGLPTSAIAKQFGISPITVRRHVSELLRKLDVPTREAAVALLDDVQD